MSRRLDNRVKGVGWIFNIQNSLHVKLKNEIKAVHHFITTPPFPLLSLCYNLQNCIRIKFSRNGNVVLEMGACFFGWYRGD